MTEFDEPVLCRFLPSRALFRSLAVCWKFYRKVLLNVLPNIAVRQPTQALRRGLNFLLLPNTFAEEFRKVPVKVAVKVLVKVLSRPVRCSTKSSPCRLFSSDRMISWSARARGKVFFFKNILIILDHFDHFDDQLCVLRNFKHHRRYYRALRSIIES